MIRAIIFDCFGVLTVDAWQAFLDGLPQNIDVDQVRDLGRAVNAGYITGDEYLTGVEKLTGMRPPDVEQAFYGETVKNTLLLDYIGELKQRYTIGLLSNVSSDWIQREFLTATEQKLFDTMIFSYEVGMVKPDPRVFMLACERLRVGPHEAIMVDDVDGYVAAARSEGLHGIVYKGVQSFKQQLDQLISKS